MKGAKFVAMLLVCALCVFAGDPWDDKEPKSWSEKDVDKILYSSPWGKKVPTKVEEVKSEDKRNEVRSTQTFERGARRETDIVVAWWWSSKTVRRAFLRLYELKGGQVDPAQAREFAETDIEPTVSLMGSDKGSATLLAMWGKLSPEDLKQNAWLDLGRFKEPIYPTDVRIVEDSKGNAERILFVFPETVGDQPVVTADDKRILFRWRLPKKKDQKPEDSERYEASFEPKKMQVQKAADF